MPYIKKEDREKFDDDIKDLSSKIETEGELNYVITKLCFNWIKKKRLCYSVLNSVIGVLTCVIQEFYSRVVAPYEEEKVKENTDVYV